jgi:tetratricopeptide (TPR) repeat protein
MRKLVVVLLLGLLLATAGGVGLARQPDSSPTAAPSGTSTVQPGAGGDLAAAIASLQSAVRRVPTDHRSWALLGLAYVEQVRITGDVTRYDLADEAVRRSFELQPDDNFSALASSAAIDAARHSFSSALTKADEALAINPLDPGALAIRVDALTELGRYPAQLAALRTADSTQPSIGVASRYAYAFELRGQLDRAATALRGAAVGTRLSERAYVLTLLADVERRRGHLARSAGLIREALREQPGYVEALVARARLSVAQGDDLLATRQWEEVVRLLPDADHRIELAELYEHLGRPGPAREQYDAVEATISSLLDSGVNAVHEVAVFEADHGDPVRALEAARQEWRRQKNIHVADALAWALHRTGASVQALVFALKATRLGTAEAIPWIHRGTIEAAVGMDQAARRHLRRGLATDAGLNPWQAARATAMLERLGTRP